MFVRAGRAVALSHAGEAFVGPARRVLREVANLRVTAGARVLPFAPGLVRPVTVVYAPSGLSPAAKALLDEIVRDSG